jgi:TRAP-type mannitol/chloroaromatic compound transport system permease large subunit
LVADPYKKQPFLGGIIPFMIAQMIAVALIYVFPKLATWLPAVAYGV